MNVVPFPNPSLPDASDIASIFDRLRTQAGGEQKMVDGLIALLEALGWSGDSDSLSDALPYGDALWDEITFRNIMAALGYRSQSAKLSLAHVSEEKVPGLLRSRTQGLLIVLEHSGEGQWLCMETTSKRRFMVEDGTIQGEYCWFKPFDQEDIQDEGNGLLASKRWFSQSLSRFSYLGMSLLGISLIVSLMALLMPLMVMVVYDKVIGARSVETMPMLAAGILLILGLEAALRLARQSILSWAGARLGMIVNIALFTRLLYLPAAWSPRMQPTAQLARVKAFESVREFLSGPLFQAVLEIPFLWILMFAVALLGGALVWVPVAVITLYMLVFYVTQGRIRKRVKEAAYNASLVQQLALEGFLQPQTIHASGIVQAFLKRFERASGHAAVSSFRASVATAMLEHVSYGLVMLGGLAFINFGVHRIWEGTLSAGALVAIMIISWRMLSPLQLLGGLLPHMEQLKASIDQVDRLMAASPERNAGWPLPPSQDFRGQVTLSQLVLRHTRNADPLFAGLNMEVQPGQLVAITGGNGSGKTSLLKLVNGLLLPQMGSVRIDGVDIRQMDPSWLRRQISYVPQLPDLFTGTVRENLLLAAPMADDETLKRALELADAWRDIQALPQGLETPIGDGGMPVTDGLHARLGLARLYINPHALILCDELPYSLLSSRAGDNFKQFLASCKGNRTVIMITHRSDLMEMADVMVWLRADLPPMVNKPSEIMALKQRAEYHIITGPDAPGTKDKGV